MALSLAEKGIYSTKPNPRVGCVLVKDDKLVGQGWHKRAGEPHAEIIALQDANKNFANVANVEGATAYINLEPCCHEGRTSPCVDALIAAKISNLFVATADPNPLVNGAGISKLRDAGIKVDVGLLEEDARLLNRGFIHRHTNNRPWVRVKIAQSLDGLMVLDKSKSTNQRATRQWITGEESRRDVHLWRAKSCAVLSGASSISKDNSRLNVRLDKQDGEKYVEPYVAPLRIALDPQFGLDPQLDFFTTAGPKLWVGTDAGKIPQKIPKDTELLIMPAQQQTNSTNSINLTDLLVKLSNKDINELLVESGPRLINAFLFDELADEMLVYIAPRFLRAQATTNNDIVFNSLHNMTYKFEFMNKKMFGEDLRLTLKPKY